VVPEVAVGEGQRDDRDDDQHPVHDDLVVQHPLEQAGVSKPRVSVQVCG
jgi:hypothetical protein